ncbi:hypothetical protein WSSLDB02_11790 [Weissella soli]|nr:hypothetical protein WSSLDB02_11790 [Weissella soli]
MRWVGYALDAKLKARAAGVKSACPTGVLVYNGNIENVDEDTSNTHLIVIRDIVVGENNDQRCRILLLSGW